uniref:DDE Tnp4 domain-containing protein n=1 Tax=Spongospora subterranea TaxID=70186 RepID=A0A0H5R3M5_9EUKA|eukprot:CRZ08498.1 hypothetical protein [Spongospora subterranea]
MAGVSKQCRFSNRQRAKRLMRSANQLVQFILCVRQARNVNRRRNLIRDLGALRLLPFLEVDEFKQEVRCSQQTFARIVSQIENCPVFHNDSATPQREVWVQLACALHRLGHCGSGASLGIVSRAKGVGYGTVSLYTKRVITALDTIAAEYIFWPDSEGRRELSAQNHREFGFEGCILSTDGTHVVLSQMPKLQGEVYWSRKCKYSFNVILTFDRKRQVRYIVSGWPGSVHDAKAWESGSVSKNPGQYFPEGQYQLGDSGFTMTREMLVPYRQPAASNPENAALNLRLSSARVVSEHGNGILKGRWQSLRGLRICINKPEDVRFACQWISACCVLHNMVNRERRTEDFIDRYEEDQEGIDASNQLAGRDRVPISLSNWRREIQSTVLDFWS